MYSWLPLNGNSLGNVVLTMYVIAIAVCKCTQPINLVTLIKICWGLYFYDVYNYLLSRDNV